MTIYYLRDKDGLIDAYTDARQAAEHAMQQDAKMREDVHITDDQGNRVADLRLDRVEIETKSVALGDTHREEKTLDCSPDFRKELGDDADLFDKKAARERAAVRAQEREHAERQEESPTVAAHGKENSQGQQHEQQPKALSLREQIARDVQLLRLQNDLDRLNRMFNLDGKQGGQQQEKQQEREASQAQGMEFEGRTYYLHVPDSLGRDQVENVFDTATGANAAFLRDGREGAYLADQDGNRHAWKERDGMSLKTMHSEDMKAHVSQEVRQFDSYAKEQGIDLATTDKPVSGFRAWLAEKKQEQQQKEQQEPARLETTLRQQHDYSHDFSHGA